MKNICWIFLVFSFISCENEVSDSKPNTEPEEFSLTLNINPNNAGTLSKSSGVYPKNESLSIAATANENYEFEGWTGSITSNNNPLSVIMDSNKQINANFNPIEIPSVQVFTNTINVSTDNENIEDILRTFYDPSGVFSYSSSGSMYTFYPGVADWVPGQNGTTETVNEVSSQILKKEGDVWVFHENDIDASFWGMRNYEILGNKVVIGDGNEIGDGQNDRWKGNLFFGEIIDDGKILWTKVNKSNEMGFFHGTCTGDINGDGLLDVGVAPGINSEGINLFIQSSDGSFYRDDDFLNFDLGSTGNPFTLDFADLDNDGFDEIITADYGGGSIPDDNDHEIKIYKYDSSAEKFNLHFQINEPDLYEWGLGATSIKIHDFNNDGINDIAVAREDAGETYETGRNGFEVWKGIGNAKFEKLFSTSFFFPEVQFREFSVFDANNDGNLDILLRANGGELFKYWGDNGPEIRLNHVIWINNGSGQFNFYNEKELKFGVNMNIYNLLPYSHNDNLHFVGMWWDENESNPDIFTFDVKVNF